MSYWFSDEPTQQRGAGKKSSYNATQQGNKPTFFHNEADVELFYPSVPQHTLIRRTKPGGENVRRTAALNDKLFQQNEINRESIRSQQLAAWHSHREQTSKQGEARRNDKQLTADLQVANAELKILRRARLKQLLEAEQQQYKRELAAKGLAILYDEP